MISLLRLGGLLLCGLVLGAAEPNHPPTIAPAPGYYSEGTIPVMEDFGTTVVAIGGIGTGGEVGQVLTITTSSDRPGLIPAPTVQYAQGNDFLQLNLISVKDAVGSATITVTVRDDGGGDDTVSMTFEVLVIPLNDPPSFVAGLGGPLIEDGPARDVIVFQISPGPTDESSQRISLYASPTDPSLIEVISVSYVPGASEGTVRIRAKADIPDDIPITYLLITAIDSGPSLGGHFNTFSFAAIIQLQAVNDPPLIAANVPTAAAVGAWTFLDADNLRVSDADGQDPIFALTTPPVLGELLLYDEIAADFRSLVPGETWLQSDIAAGRLVYHHGGTPVGPGAVSDAFSFTLDDGVIAAPLGPDSHLLVLDPDPAVPPAVELYTAGQLFSEGDPPVILAPLAVVRDDGADLSGGLLRLTLGAGTGTDDRLAIIGQGIGAGQIAVAGGVVSYGNRLIATVSGGSDGVPLEMLLQGPDCTPAAVQALLRRVAFGNDSDAPGTQSRSIVVVLDDGDGGVSPAVATQVAVTPVEDPPRLTVTRVATPAWTSRYVSLPCEDADGGTYAWSIVSQPSSAVLTVLDPAAGLFTLTASGPGEETCTVQVSDGVNPASQAVIRLTIDGGDGARPHPLADPPRQAVAGEELVFDLPFDTADLGAGASLDAAVTADAPVGVVLSALESATVRVNWLVPADLVPGSYTRFGLVAADRAGRGATLVPFTLRIVAPPAGAN